MLLRQGLKKRGYGDDIVEVYASRRERTSKVSMVPAQTISPLLSTASDTYCTGSGDVKVRKLRYRTRSNARTVPASVPAHLPTTFSPDVCWERGRGWVADGAGTGVPTRDCAVT